MGLLASQTYTAQYRGRVSIDPTFSSQGQLTQLFYVNQILLFSLDSGMDITIKIVWRLGLCPRPQLGAHITPGTSFILKDMLRGRKGDGGKDLIPTCKHLLPSKPAVTLA